MKIIRAVAAAVLAASYAGNASEAAPQHAQLLLQTQSCWRGKIERPTQTFVAVFTREQAAPLDKMWRERKRFSDVLDADQKKNPRKTEDAASAYFDFSNKFFDQLGTRPALARIKHMKGWWVRLATPIASNLVVYGYRSDEGEVEPEPVRIEVVPNEKKEAVVTLDYTDPVLCKYRGSGNPYAANGSGK
jgi:hypothetical protein